MNVRELKNQLHDWIETGDIKLLKMIFAVSKVYLSDKTELLEEEKEDDVLYRLIYSSSRKKSCSDTDIDQILEASRKNNPSKNITGLLVHTDDRFLQILEGPLSNVMSTYHKISKDSRHGGARIRYCEPADQRHFSNWHMGFKDLAHNDVDFETSISPEEQKLYDSLVDGDLTSYEDESMLLLKTFLAVS